MPSIHRTLDLIPSSTTKRKEEEIEGREEWEGGKEMRGWECSSELEHTCQYPNEISQ